MKPQYIWALLFFSGHSLAQELTASGTYHNLSLCLDTDAPSVSSKHHVKRHADIFGKRAPAAVLYPLAESDDPPVVESDIGSIEIDIGNVTVVAGKVDLHDVELGNISVIISAAIGDQSVVPTSIFSSATSIATSTTSGVLTSAPATSTTTTILQKRQESTSSVSTVAPSSTIIPAPLPSGIDLSNITSSTNIILNIGNILLQLGDVNITNVTIGNILIAIVLGTGDVVGNTTQLLASFRPDLVST